ncbi:MAG: PEP-CTERM sorting domain-containing protein [Planctomycetota bacterium]|nr:PEP-CTERM sorting domain-containing protein [Planctomycetota bacterium]
MTVGGATGSTLTAGSVQTGTFNLNKGLATIAGALAGTNSGDATLDTGTALFFTGDLANFINLNVHESLLLGTTRSLVNITGTTLVDSGKTLTANNLTGGSLMLNDATANFNGDLTLTGNVTVGGLAGAGNLTAGATQADAFHLVSGTAAVGSLTAVGTAKSVTVDAGQTLMVNGPVTGHKLISVMDPTSKITGTGSLTLTGKLAGAGTVELPLITIESGGVISPGQSPGPINTKNLTWMNSGMYLWEISDATSGPGTGWDVINVDGNLDLASLTTTFTVDIHGLTPALEPGEPNSYVPGTQYAWKIASATSIIGFDAGKFTFTQSDPRFLFNMGASPLIFVMEKSGNDLVLAMRPPTDVRTWLATASAPGTWSTAANWDYGVPTDVMPAVFNAKDGTTAMPDLTAPGSVLQLEFLTGGWTINQTAGPQTLTVASGNISSTGDAGTTNTIKPEIAIGGGAAGATFTVAGDATHNLALETALALGTKTLNKEGIGKLTTAAVTAGIVNVNNGSMNSGAMTAGTSVNIGAGATAGSLTAASVNTPTFNLAQGSAAITGALTGTGAGNATLASGTAFSAGSVANFVDVAVNTDANLGAISSISGTTSVNSTATMTSAGMTGSKDLTIKDSAAANFGTNNVTLTGTLTLNTSATGFATTGLLAGSVAGNANWGATNPGNMGITAGPDMAFTSDKPPWIDDVTYIYTGQYYSVDGGTDNWCGDIDNSHRVMVQGVEASVNNSNTFTYGSTIDLGTAGWKDIEIRVGNGTLGAGMTRPPLGIGIDFTGTLTAKADFTIADAANVQYRIWTPWSLVAADVTADAVNMINGVAEVGSLTAYSAGSSKTVMVGSGTTLNVVGAAGIAEFNTLTVEGTVAAGVNPISMSSTGVVDIGVGGGAASLTAGSVNARTFNMAKGTATIAGALTLTGTATVSGGTLNAGAASADVFHMVDGTATVGSLAAYSGGASKSVVIEAGKTLTVNGTVTGHSLINVKAGATLAGVDPAGVGVTLIGLLTGPGTVNLPITIDGGTISPGASPGSMKTKNQTWKSGVYLWEICDVGPLTGGAGAAATNPGWDKLNIDGTLDLATIAGTFTIAINSLTHTGGDVSGQADSYVPGTDYTWTIASATAITGFDAGKFAFDTTGWTGALGGKTFKIDSDGTNLFLEMRTATLNRIWTAASSPGAWSVAGSWDYGIPGTSNPVFFKDNGAAAEARLSADSDVASLTFEKGGYTIGVTSGTEKLNVAAGGFITSTDTAATTNTITPEVVFADPAGATITVAGDTGHNLSLLAALDMSNKTLNKEGIGKLTATTVKADKLNVNGGSAEIVSLFGAGTNLEANILALASLKVTGGAGMTNLNKVSVAGTLDAGTNPITTTTTGSVTVGNLTDAGILTAGDVSANIFNLTKGQATVAKLLGIGSAPTATLDSGTTFTMSGSQITGWQNININTDVNTVGGAISTLPGGLVQLNAGTLTAGTVTAGTFNVGSTASVTGLVNVSGTTTVSAGKSLTAGSHTGGNLTVYGTAGYGTGAVSLTGTATVGNGIAAASLTAGSVTGGTILTVADAASASIGSFNMDKTVVNGTMTITDVVQNQTKELEIGTNGQLDIARSSLLVDFTGAANPADTIKGYLASGYDDMAWDGKGIMSTNAASVYPTAVGYLDNYNDAAGDGSESVLVKYTFYGDGNLDGLVDVDNDFSGFLDGLNGVGTSWYYGDYNHDGVVDVDNDFSLFLDALNMQSGITLGEAGPVTMLSTLSAVPEPATLGLMALGLAAMALRRRRAAK